MPLSSIANCPECPGADCANCVLDPGNGGGGNEDGGNGGGGGGGTWVPFARLVFVSCEEYGYPDCHVSVIRCDYGSGTCMPETQGFCSEECFGW